MTISVYVKLLVLVVSKNPKIIFMYPVEKKKDPSPCHPAIRPSYIFKYCFLKTIF